MLSLRMAIRNLLRNRWRSGLAAGGIAVATAMLIWNLGFIDGFLDMMVRGATDVETGHLQIQDERYVEQPATMDYFEWNDEVRQTVEATPGVLAVTPRIRLFGLVGHEERSHIGRIIGIDPVTEPQVTVMDRGIVDGRWLDESMPETGPAEVVIGIGLSRTLRVGVGDELVVIAEAVDGSMGDGLLEIVGIVQTGNSRIDRQAALLHMEEAEFIAAMEGAVHEAVVAIEDPPDAPDTARAVQQRLNAAGYDHLRVRPWQEVEPALHQMLLYTNTANFVIFAIIFFIVALGVLNALRMSARERYREFGVMMAVGMSRAKMFSLIVIEGFLLGVVGAALGAGLGAAITGYHSVRGLDLSGFVDGDATYMGVSFADRIHFVISAETLLLPTLGLVMVSVVCALWPALSATRLVPRDAMSGRD